MKVHGFLNIYIKGKLMVSQMVSRVKFLLIFYFVTKYVFKVHSLILTKKEGVRVIGWDYEEFLKLSSWTRQIP
jgi:hypothetical protein